MSPLTDRDVAELDNWLKARIIRSARESLTPEMSAAERSETLQEGMILATKVTWMSGLGALAMGCLDGLAQIFWTGLKHNHPELKADEVRAMLMNPASLEEAQAEFDRLNLTAGVGGKKKAKAKK